MPVQTDVPRPRTAPPPAPTPAVCLVGAGPRALGVLDRLGAHVARGGGDLVVHVLDPFPPGGGRIWRTSQHPLLWMNSRAADVTVLPDASSTLPGPLRHGPTLHAWAAEHRAELARGFAAEGEDALRAEVLALAAGSFPSRALAGRYLGWAWDRVVEGLPAGVDLRVRADRAVEVTDLPGGRQRVALEAPGAAALEVDAVLLAQGHPDARPTPREEELTRFAAAHGLRHVPPGYTSDLGLTDDTALVRPGEDVLVLGMGLAFVDLVVLLTEARGGRHVETGDGGLRYEPSGREPVLRVGSRRGVPYHSKITYELGERPPLPRFATLDALRALGTGLDLRADVWPLLVKELAGAHCAELFRAHPERTALDAATFDARFAALPAGDAAALAALQAQAVPDPEDRFDVDALDRPLHHGPVPDGGWHDRVRAHVAADVARRGDPRHSADAAVFAALLSCYGTVAAAAREGLLSAAAARDVDGWWHGFFSSVASGPPPQRLRQLLALADAGVVEFLGPDVEVVADVRGGRAAFRARGAGGRDLGAADVLVDARLPSPAATASADPVLGGLTAAGALRGRSGRVDVDGEQRVLAADGTPHPARFAAGPWVAGGGWAPAFPRPGLDAGFFHLNDRVAQRLLAAARRSAGSATSTGTRRAR